MTSGNHGQGMIRTSHTYLPKGFNILGIGLVAPALMYVATGAALWATALADEEKTQGVFLENPRRDDPALELQRLRLEGIAHYEAGLALDDASARFVAAFEKSGSADDAFNVALVHFRKNDTPRMLEWLDKALSLDPRHPNANYLSGVQAKTEGDFEAAREYWQTTAETVPGDAQLHYQLALIARNFRDDADFLQGLINALNLDPDHPGALYQLFRHYRSSESKVAAQDIMKRFTAVKRKERFSRREKAKEPSSLVLPIAGRLDRPDPFRETEIKFAAEIRPAGCRLDSVHAAPDLAGETLTEYVVGICDTGEVLRFDPRNDVPERLGSLPDGAESVLVEALDAAGRRVIARAGDTLVASNVIGTGPLSFVPLGAVDGVAALGDIDSDGDLDIVFTGGELPLTNAGDMTFKTEPRVYEDSPLLSVLTGATDVAVVDLRRMGSADFAAVAGSRVSLVAGDVLGYEDAWSLDMGAELTAIGVEDLDGSGQPDFVVTSVAGVSVIWDPQPAVAPETAPETVLASRTFGRALTADLNNDGLIDVLAMDSAGTLRVRLNRGGRSFDAVQRIALGVPSTELVTADVNADGKLDLIHGDAEGNLAVAANASDAGYSVRILLKGVRSAPSGLMTQVEIRSGQHYIYQQSRGGVVHAGLGDDAHAEIVRIEWTNGFVENKLKVDGRIEPYWFEESERISGSCPSVFTWDGERFRYVSDAFISGPMGVPVDRGIYFPIGDRETMVLEADDLAPLDGSLQIRFTEELRETVYLDRIELEFVDHPAGSVVAPNSRLAPAPPASNEFYVALKRTPTVDARASNGLDMTAALARADGVYADYFKSGRNAGFAEPHWLEFKIPDSVEPGDVDALLARGWFYYFDSTSMISEAQSTGGRIGWPMLEEKVDGTWETVGPVGLPAGKDKYVVMPLRKELRSRELRITSAVSAYWDRIELSLADGTADAAVSTPLALEEADLRFRGLSRMAQRHPERFDYHSLSHMTMWNPMVGRYTAYGAVDDLVSREDGLYAIFGTGDEIAFRFSVPTEEPAPGMTRSFLLRFIGFVKDGDRYTVDADRVDPLPFLGMRSYPASPPSGYAVRESAMLRTRYPLDFTLSTVSKDQRP